jgi:hypothetical protein
MAIHTSASDSSLYAPNNKSTVPTSLTLDSIINSPTSMTSVTTVECLRNSNNKLTASNLGLAERPITPLYNNNNNKSILMQDSIVDPLDHSLNTNTSQWSDLTNVTKESSPSLHEYSACMDINDDDDRSPDFCNLNPKLFSDRIKVKHQETKNLKPQFQPDLPNLSGKPPVNRCLMKEIDPSDIGPIREVVIVSDESMLSEQSYAQTTPLIIANFSNQQRKKEAFTFFSASDSFNKSNAQAQLPPQFNEIDLTGSIPFVGKQKSKLENNEVKVKFFSSRKPENQDDSVPSCIKCVHNFFSITKSFFVSLFDFIRAK